MKKDIKKIKNLFFLNLNLLKSPKIIKIVPINRTTNFIGSITGKPKTVIINKIEINLPKIIFITISVLSNHHRQFLTFWHHHLLDAILIFYLIY